LVTLATASKEDDKHLFPCLNVLKSVNPPGKSYTFLLSVIPFFAAVILIVFLAYAKISGHFRVAKEDTPPSTASNAVQAADSKLQFRAVLYLLILPIYVLLICAILVRGKSMIYKALLFPGYWILDESDEKSAKNENRSIWKINALMFLRLSSLFAGRELWRAREKMKILRLGESS
jgi:hypothetical protein